MNIAASNADAVDYVAAQQIAAGALPAAGTPWLDASLDKPQVILTVIWLPTPRL